MSFYAFYFVLYAQVALGITFMPLWLRSQGLTETGIGILLAVAAMLAVGINPLVGGVADRTRRNKAMLIGLIVLATLASFAFLAQLAPVLVASVFLVYRLVSAPLIPLSESILIANLAAYRLEFGWVRALGSASVVATTLLCGFLVDWTGPAAIVSMLAVILLMQIVLSTALPNARRDGSDTAISPAAIAKTLRNRGFLLLIGSAAISQACHGVFYAYSTFRWLEAGHSTSAIGVFWGIGVGAEIVAFACGRQITASLSPARIIAVACLAGTLRWGLFGLSAGLLPTLAVQILQGATLGMTQVGVAAYLRQNMPSEFLASATGVYSACGGLFTGLCILIGGRLYLAGSGNVFLFTAALCILALFFASLMVRFERPAQT